MRGAGLKGAILCSQQDAPGPHQAPIRLWLDLSDRSRGAGLAQTKAAEPALRNWQQA